MSINVLNEDWPVRYAQFQRMADHDNSEAVKRYRAAMRDWRLNAEVERNNGRPLPPKPQRAYALMALWNDPHDIYPPALEVTSEFVCEEEPGLPDPPAAPPTPGWPLGTVINISGWMGPGSTKYHVGAGDNAPDGATIQLVKRIQIGIGGTVQWYERLS